MNDDLAVRLERLAPWQRQWLAASLAADPAAAGASSRLVAWVVPEADREPGLGDLRAYLGARLPDYMVPQQFIAADMLPRGPGGKVDRAVLGAQTSRVDAPPREPQAAASGVEAILADIWADVLGLEYVGVDENFFELGGDSLLSIRILSRARRAGLALSPEAFFAHPTVAAQARQTSDVGAGTRSAPATGDLPLTPIAHWFFERTPVDPGHWNQCFEWRLDAAVTPAIVASTLRELLRQHDALRLGFVSEANGWRARLAAPDAEAPLTVVDSAAALRGDELEQEVERLAWACNSGIDLARGPMLRATLVRTAPDLEDRLLVAMHHLGTDALSWRILAEDLETLCQQLVAERPMSLPAPTASFKLWSQRLVEFAQSEAVRRQVGYWHSAVTAATAQLPVDHVRPPHANRCETAASIRLRLGPKESAQLGAQSLARRGAHAVEALLAALTVAIGAWRGHEALLIDIEGHGREALFGDLDVSRTVGWFTSVYPFVLRPGRDVGASLEDVLSRLRSVPMHGMGFGLLRHLNADPALGDRLLKVARPQLLLNYLGSIDAAPAAADLLTLAREWREPARSPRGLRAYAIEINAWVSAGQLEIDWQYSRELHREETMRSCVNACADALREIAASSRERPAVEPTAQDFPLAQLDPGEFARLSGLLDDGTEDST